MATVRLNDEGRESWAAFELAIAGTTHVGRIRKTNQDAFDRFDDPERGEILLVVADGMGGHRGGEVASRMAVGTLGKLCRESEGDPRFRLEYAIERANFEIHKLASQDRTLQGMGTTLVAVLLCPEGSIIRGTCRGQPDLSASERPVRAIDRGPFGRRTYGSKWDDHA